MIHATVWALVCTSRARMSRSAPSRGLSAAKPDGAGAASHVSRWGRSSTAVLVFTSSSDASVGSSRCQVFEHEPSMGRLAVHARAVQILQQYAAEALRLQGVMPR